MEGQQPPGTGVRAVYTRLRGERRAHGGQRPPAATVDGYLRGLEADPGRGDADMTGLAGLLTAPMAKRALALAAKPYGAGLLVITSGQVELALLFAPSGLKAALRGARFASIARRLLDQGKLGPNEQKKLEAARPKHRTEFEALQAIGLAAETLAEAAGELIGQQLLDGLFWDVAVVEAVTGEGSAGNELLARRDVDVLAVPSRTIAKGLVQGLTDRIDALAQAMRSLPSPRVPLQPATGTGGGRSASLTGKQAELLAAITARPGVTPLELSQDEALGRRPLHVVAQDLHELVTRAMVTLGQAKPAQDEASPETSLSPLACRLRLARIAAERNDRRRAARLLSRVGHGLLEQQRAAEAARCFAAVHALHPQDLEGHDGLVQALFASGKTEEAAAEAEDLVRHYLDAHLPSRARRVAQRWPKDDPAMQVLLIEAALALGEARTATELGERCVGKLRAAGRKAEAQALTEALVDSGADAPARLAEATGGLASPLLARAAGAVALGLAVGLLLSARDLWARQAYAASVGAAEAALARDPLDLEAVRPLLAAAWPGKAGQLARRANDALGLLEQDRAMLEQAAQAVKAPTIAERRQRLEPLRAKTPAGQRALDEVRRALQARVHEVEQRVIEVQRRANDGDVKEALALARRLFHEAPDAPDLLGAVSLKLRITSSPTPATLRWDGAAITQPTPFQDASVPLWGARTIEVSLPGHRTVRRTLTVLTVFEPVVHVTLRRLRQGEKDDPVDETPAPAPAPLEGEGRVVLVDGVVKEGAAPPFEPSLDPFQEQRLLEGERARVELVHEVAAGQPTLALVRVTLERRDGTSWKPVRGAVTFKPPSSVVRPLRRQPDGQRRAAPLDETPGLELAWLRDQVKKAIAHARASAGANAGGGPR